MNRLKALFVDIIDKLYFVEKTILPKVFIKQIYFFVSTAFEDEAIDCYLSDRQDIGFFENFILGADETKKLTKETNNRFQDFKKGDLMEKMSGYITPQHIIKLQQEEMMQEHILTKKNMVIEQLKGKGEIIRYLGRRIVTRNEKLYQKLERVYNKLYEDLRDSLEKPEEK
jgi:hypothetical protein